MLNGLERIKELVEKYPDRRQQTLMHLINKENLKIIHDGQEWNKAPGQDSITKLEYDKNLDENLDNLIERMKAYKYKVQPVRRVNIDKGNGKTRPLGIPAYEDKLVQGVMSQVLNTIYEPKFLDCSYGFRPGRSAHDAIKELYNILFDGTNYVVEIDIKGFFDNVDHTWLRKFLEHEIEDKNFMRYIGRFLNAGVVEEGKYYRSDDGVPQGGAISPILANIYLHYVVDLWFEKKIKPQTKGMAKMIRYADDITFCFEYKTQAEKFYENIKERLKEFNLELSEEKSKIIEFGRYSKKNERFEFLGFTVTNGKTKNGKYVPIFTTSEKKLKQKRKNVYDWLNKNMHVPIEVLIKSLNRKLNGHYNYYGVSRNYEKMKGFRSYILMKLFKVLRRRGQKGKMTYDKFNRILKYNHVVTPKIKVRLW